MSDIEIITTEDGSHSLFHARLQETYHSRHGAIVESQHVFINHGLEYCQNKKPNQKLSILEVGFGTGLNVLLTVASFQKNKSQLRYLSIEPYPLDQKLVDLLNYSSLVPMDSASRYFEKIHGAPWNEDVEILPGFTLRKEKVKLQDLIPEKEDCDLIYYDAFAPSKQPELWEIANLDKIQSAMKSQAVFVTYCAKGQLKRDLRSLGLTVETLPGPPGKKEMVRATKP